MEAGTVMSPIAAAIGRAAWHRDARSRASASRYDLQPDQDKEDGQGIARNAASHYLKRLNAHLVSVGTTGTAIASGTGFCRTATMRLVGDSTDIARAIPRTTTRVSPTGR